MFELLDPTMHDAKPVGNGVYYGSLKSEIPFCNVAQRTALCVSAPSVSSYLEFLKEHCPTPQRGGSSSAKGDGHFHPLNSYEEAMDIFINRPNTIRKFTAKDDAIVDPDAIGNDVLHDVAGDFLDLGRYLEGSPECFGNMAMGNPLGLFATIVLTLSVSGATSHSVLNRRAERILRLVDWLESQKIRTQVKLLEVNECSYVECAVKEFDQHFDMDALAVAGHADFYRRMIFRLQEYSPTWTSGYGTVANRARGSLALPKQYTTNTGIFIFSENFNVGSVETVDNAFNKLENDIAKSIENGDRNFSTFVPSGR